VRIYKIFFFFKQITCGKLITKLSEKTSGPILIVAAALRATATAELSYSLINRLADKISCGGQARGSRLIVACLLLRVPRNQRHRLAPPLALQKG